MRSGLIGMQDRKIVEEKKLNPQTDESEWGI